jgi:hypothetical protein
MTRRPFTLIMPFYRNAGQLQRQYKRLARLPEDVRSHLALIIVDDGSPKEPALPPKSPLGLLDFQLYRVEVDVRWNWLTCRNIGVHHATTDWVLLTDIDHELPEATARRIIDRKLDATNVYRFSRVDAPKLTAYKPHPNSWLMTRRMFDRIGGYDERFSGFYGTDGEFRDRVNAAAADVIMLPEVLIRVPREVVPDASTTTYQRKQPEDHEGVTAVRARIAQEGGRPLRLSFPYHRVA